MGHRATVLVELATTLVLDHKQTCSAEELQELFPVVDTKLAGAFLAINVGIFWINSFIPDLLMDFSLHKYLLCQFEEYLCEMPYKVYLLKILWCQRVARVACFSNCFFHFPHTWCLCWKDKFLLHSVFVAWIVFYTFILHKSFFYSILCNI